MKFNSKVKIYDGKKIREIYLKTWDGISPSNKLYQEMIILISKTDIKTLNDLISRQNIFEVFKIKAKIESLLQRMLFFSGKKDRIPILPGGGGKNACILINQINYNNIVIVKNTIDHYAYKQNKDIVLMEL